MVIAALTKPLLSRATIRGYEVSQHSGSTRQGWFAQRFATAPHGKPGGYGASAGVMGPQSFGATIILGIDGLQRTLDVPSRATSADHDLPYHRERISRTGERGGLLRLIFAVAGFAPEQLEISVAGDQLSISGEQNGDGDPQRYLHRGIASRRFRRVFRLTEHLAVERATLETGLLPIDLRGSRHDRAGRTIEIGVRDP